jgi:hypothetical protein
MLYSATIHLLRSAGKDVTMQLVESTIRREGSKLEECANVLRLSRWVQRLVNLKGLQIYVCIHRCSQLYLRIYIEHVWLVFEGNATDKYS